MNAGASERREPVLLVYDSVTGTRITAVPRYSFRGNLGAYPVLEIRCDDPSRLPMVRYMFSNSDLENDSQPVFILEQYSSDAAVGVFTRYAERVVNDLEMDGLLTLGAAAEARENLPRVLAATTDTPPPSPPGAAR